MQMHAGHGGRAWVRRPERFEAAAIGLIRGLIENRPRHEPVARDLAVFLRQVGADEDDFVPESRGQYCRINGGATQDIDEGIGRQRLKRIFRAERQIVGKAVDIGAFEARPAARLSSDSSAPGTIRP